jgi:hypothetical protein
VLGVADQQVERAAGLQGAEVVQRAAAQAVAVGGVTAVGTPSTAIVARAVANQRRGEILNTGNPLGGVGGVLSGAHR